jgi:hypothetical protein
LNVSAFADESRRNSGSPSNARRLGAAAGHLGDEAVLEAQIERDRLVEPLDRRVRRRGGALLGSGNTDAAASSRATTCDDIRWRSIKYR